MKGQLKGTLFFIFILMFITVFVLVTVEKAEKNKQLQYLEATYDQCPDPMWVKASDGRMLWFNEAYYTTFLKPYGIRKEDYTNHYDAAVWGKELASQFREQDIIIIKTLKPQRIEEDFVFQGDTLKLHHLKFPVRFPNGELGVAGRTYIERSSVWKD